MKHFLPVFVLLAMGLPMAAMAGTVPRTCTEADFKGLPSPSGFMGVSDERGLDGLSDEMRQGTLIGYFKDFPTIRYPYGSLDSYGFTVRFVADVDGRVTCASLASSLSDDRAPRLNVKRQALLDSVPDWRFVPFEEDGKPTAVAGWMLIFEEELPARHVPMPAGDPAQMMITYDHRASHFNPGSYHIELHGDGTAIYMRTSDDNPLGPQSYHVDAKQVQALLADARKADFWSLRDLYREAPGSYLDSYSRTNITLGGKTKSVTYFDATKAGMPGAMRELAYKIETAANSDFWDRPTLATLDQLKANGFDFTTDRAAQFLLKVTDNTYVKDEVPRALMDMGAPVERGLPDPEGGKELRFLLEIALETGRVQMARRLVDKGALLDEAGKVDAHRVDRAFLAAVDSGEVAGVDLIVPFHPDMTYPDPDDASRRVSILCRLGDWRHARTHWRSPPQAMAQRLLELGADVNVRMSNGSTLLQVWASDVSFARFLLDHGADINTVDKEGWTPLSYAFNEDAALFLLSRGADPRLGKTAVALRLKIKHERWHRVPDWMKTHGYADLLVPQPDDAKEDFY